MKIYNKDSLIKELQRIRSTGWVPNARSGNVGGIGNTLEDLLGIEENNLPIPNASEWELKCQREGSSSLITLFHMEPSPRAMKFVPIILLPNYGWKHEQAGGKYSQDEISFRQTINAASRSDRGFCVVVDRNERKLKISLDASQVGSNHLDWLEEVSKRVNLAELKPQPYWGFDDLMHKAGTKLINCFFVQAQVKKENHREYFLYSKISILQNFCLEGILSGFEKGYLYIDFYARSGHNHGTKFRIRQNKIQNLYEHVVEI